MNSQLSLNPGDGPGSANTVNWTAELLLNLDVGEGHVAPLIREADFARYSDDFDVWDSWPVQLADGQPAQFEGGVTLWMALAATRFADPDERPGHARIHLLQRDASGWTHLGPVMPDGFAPGSREWSGSAVLSRDLRDLTLYFTATGRRDEAELTFEQRIFSATARLAGASGSYRFGEWSGLDEIIRRDPTYYMASDAGGASPGKIKAFRDPAYFRDPRSGAHYIFFAASKAGSASDFNGVIGASRLSDVGLSQWEVLPPVVSADGFNNELERPHVRYHKGLYYLFWSTQAHVFAPDGPTGPTGLYGMASERLDGGWQPLNASGLVFANPPQAPRQAYSWLVLPELGVISFVDDWGNDEEKAQRRFGVAFAPELTLELEGVTARLVTNE